MGSDQGTRRIAEAGRLRAHEVIQASACHGWRRLAGLLFVRIKGFFGGDCSMLAERDEVPCQSIAAVMVPRQQCPPKMPPAWSMPSEG